LSTPPFGPQYCETPDAITGIFPVEPANAISSGIIVVFGLFALASVYRRTPTTLWFYVLCALLITNGLGSILWHGLRTRWALTLDVLPALVFVAGAIILWARYVASWREGLLVTLGAIALALVVRFADLPVRGGWTMMAPFIITIAIWLIARSYTVSNQAALTGGLALASATAALTFRSIDGSMCETVPMGTHFLWHVFLSAAAFMCMQALITLETNHRTLTPAPAA
jgi:hypothetical protein